MDARNPYFFYSADLEKYIKEVDRSKQFILLINKADYLSEELIIHWNNYFKEIKVNHIFFSAKIEQEKLDLQEEDDSSSESDNEQDSEEEKEFEPMFGELKRKIDIENELKEMKEAWALLCKTGEKDEKGEKGDADMKGEKDVKGVG